MAVEFVNTNSDWELDVYFDKWTLEFDVWFEHEDNYTITVDDGDIDNDEDYDVNWSNSSNEDLDDFEFDGDTTPDDNKRETIKITAVNDNPDYNEKILLTIKVYDWGSRDSADDNDIKIKSNDFDDNEDDLNSDWELDVDFHNWTLEFDIKFFRERTYKIIVEDEWERIDNYETYIINGNNEDVLNNFTFDADFTPKKNKYTEITVDAFNDEYDLIPDYDSTTLMTVEIYDWDWKQADSRDFAIDISFDENNGEDDVNFDNWKLEFKIKFKKEELYKITIEDENKNIIDSQEFDVWGQNYGDNEFKVDADPDTTDTNDWIDITVEAVNDNNDTIENYNKEIIFEVRYKYKTSNRRSKTTSNYYFEINNTDNRDKDYKNGIRFDRDWDGDHKFKKFINFKKDNYEYRLLVKEKDDTRMYGYDVIEIEDEGYSDDEVDEFEVSLSTDEAETDSRVDITVKAVDRHWNTVKDYNDDIIFTVQYKSSSTSSRKDASSSYYKINNKNNRDDDYDNWIKFDKDRNWRYRFDNFIKFNKEYEYRIIVEDDDNSRINGEDKIDIDDNYNNYNNNSSDDFSNDEYKTVEKFYSARPTLINRLKDQYYSLRYSDSWNDLSDEIYDNLKDVIEDRNNREYKDYEDFISAIRDRYYETINLR